MRAATLITMALLGLTAGILVAPYLPGRRDRSDERTAAPRPDARPT